MNTITNHKPRRIADQIETLLAQEFATGRQKPRTMRDFRSMFFPGTDQLEASYIWKQVRKYIKHDLLNGGLDLELSGARSEEDPRLWQWKFTRRASETTAVTKHAQQSKQGIDVHNSSRGHNLIGANMIGNLEDKKILDRYRGLLAVAEHFEGKALDAVSLIVDSPAEETDRAA